MIIGIDAGNIRSSGGLTHLKEFLKETNPTKQGFNKIIIWSSKNTLNQLTDLEWIEKRNHKFLNKGFIWYLVYQIFLFKKEIRLSGCSIILVPGSTFLCNFRPYVAISQNMLPFELNEAFRFKGIIKKVRFLGLRFLQSYTFKHADGLIFLSKYAFVTINKKVKISKNIEIIPHGINISESNPPKIQKNLSQSGSKFDLLYVSIITAYKHQWNVAEAICILNQQGFPIKLTLIGPKEDDSYKKLELVMNKYSNWSQSFSYLGAVSHKEIFNYYRSADAFIFASSCENLPIILIEAMACGLPIISSNKGPMPEVLGLNGGMFFDPENINDICEKLKVFYLNHELRNQIAIESYSKSIVYSWENTVFDTIKFLKKTVGTTKYGK